MKVLIDIPEEEYRAGDYCKIFGCSSVEMHSILDNGVIVEDVDDLISRSAAIEIRAKHRLELADCLRACPDDEFYSGRYSECDRTMLELREMPSAVQILR